MSEDSRNPHIPRVTGSSPNYTTLEDEYGGETYPADAIFHAKRVRTIVKFLETGAGSV